MDKPKIGLALGSGGARGFAHLGVLKVLEENNISIDYIAGSSMGALVASFYGMGHSIEQLIKLSLAFKRKFYLDFTVPKLGFINGNRIKEFIKLFTHGKNIEDLKIPIAIIATDLVKGEEVVFTKGSISDAVRASISIPGIFVPVHMNGKILVDGGVIDRIPSAIVRKMGADIVIGVDVTFSKKETEINNIYDVIMKSIDILHMEAISSRQLGADILIQPDVSQYSSTAFTNTEEIIKIGEEETWRNLQGIVDLLDQWKEGE
ncbi:patatin-like phospholipase family protein [Bacillus sp. FJAT-49736]|uniref:patatin-like phospholipase family protein n=1 Tax=Bacillus sp. FJAT-49736 TaxID=2833582 RepID=UPI001BCA5F99|nr:patatin-like phospholipase family protein [Bacillus sp. FJAT-49736]MBS4172405.1 patatin-like phospholipase family protein [Bacillus sp. FJAT-49736]